MEMEMEIEMEMEMEMDMDMEIEGGESEAACGVGRVPNHFSATCRGAGPSRRVQSRLEGFGPCV